MISNQGPIKCETFPRGLKPAWTYVTDGGIEIPPFQSGQVVASSLKDIGLALLSAFDIS